MALKIFTLLGLNGAPGEIRTPGLLILSHLKHVFAWR